MASRFGSPGVPVGTVFATRQEVFEAGVHRHTQAGIAGTQPAAQSIVLSGGYSDDIDLGDVIHYTGFGGRDANTGRQVADQELTSWNWALAQNQDLGLPVRVVRGADRNNPFAPRQGYRYDGLYDVISFSPAEGTHGFRIFHYTLVRRTGQPAVVPEGPRPDDLGPSARRQVMVSRLERDLALTLAIKELHGYRCQVSGTSISTPSGPYAEAAHIRPLGHPHDGPDNLSNLLCLCPNDHVRLDRGVLVISDDFEVVAATSGETVGELRVHEDHWLDPATIRYHRYIWTELLRR